MSPEFAEYVVDQMQDAGVVSTRKMFGGLGIYVDGTFCAIVGSSDRFYLRVGPENVEDFKAAGMRQFPGGKGKGMPYYEVPEDVLEDPSALAEWARKSRDAASAANRKK